MVEDRFSFKRGLVQLAATLAVAFLGACDLENLRDTTETLVDGDRLYISGTLNTRSHAEIIGLLDDNPDVRLVVLGDIDGTVDADTTVEIGLEIHERGLDTYLPPDGFIESGAVDLFCAGHQRIAAPGAHIGVHSWYDEETSADAISPDDEEHDAFIDYFETVGCPVDFYWFTVEAAGPDDMYVMTESEWLEWGVATVLMELE